MAFLLDHLPPQLHLVIASRADPRAAAGPAAGPRRAGRDPRRRPALHARRGRGLPQRGDGPGPRRRRTSPRWRGAPRAGSPRSSWRRSRCRAATTSRGFIAGFAGDDRYIVDYLVEEVLQRQPERVRELPAADLHPGPAERPAVRRRHRPGRRQGDAGGARAGQPVPGPARRPPPVVPLPPPLRRRAAGAPAGRAARPGRRTCTGGRARGTSRTASRPRRSATRWPPGTSSARRTWSSWRCPAMRRSRQEATLRRLARGAPRRGGPGQARAQRRRTPGRCWPAASSRASRSGCGTPSGGWTPTTGDAPRTDGGRDGRRGRGGVPPPAGGDRRVPCRLALSAATWPPRMTHARRALDLAAEDDHLGRGGAAALLGLAHWATRGSRGRAPLRTPTAWPAWRGPGTLADVIGCAITLADIRIAQGRLREAMRTYERALQLATAQAGPSLRGAADMYVGMSELLPRAGRPGRRRSTCARARSWASTPGCRRTATAGGSRWRGCGQLEGDLDGALDLLDEAERLYVGDFFPKCGRSRR